MYSLACGGLGIVPGGGIGCEAPVLGGPVEIPLDSYQKEKQKMKILDIKTTDYRFLQSLSFFKGIRNFPNNYESFSC